MSDWQEGDYEGTLTGGKCFESSQKGTPGIRLSFDVGGNEVFVDLWLSDKAFDRSMRELAKCGFNNDFENPKFSKPGPHRLNLKFEEYNGKPQKRWAFAWETKAPDPRAIASLAARAKALNPVAPPPPSSPPPKKSDTPPPAKSKKKTSWNRDEAWKVYQSVYGDKASDEWAKDVEKQEKASGRQEADFNDADYTAMVELLESDIPF